jgi:hypothetical protein
MVGVGFHPIYILLERFIAKHKISVFIVLRKTRNIFENLMEMPKKSRYL